MYFLPINHITYIWTIIFSSCCSHTAVSLSDFINESWNFYVSLSAANRLWNLICSDLIIRPHTLYKETSCTLELPFAFALSLGLTIMGLNCTVHIHYSTVHYLAQTVTEEIWYICFALICQKDYWISSERQWGSSLPVPVHGWDSLSSPSGRTRICWRTCLQSYLQTSPFPLSSPKCA